MWQQATEHIGGGRTCTATLASKNRYEGPGAHQVSHISCVETLGINFDPSKRMGRYHPEQPEKTHDPLRCHSELFIFQNAWGRYHPERPEKEKTWSNVASNFRDATPQQQGAAAAGTMDGSVGRMTRSSWCWIPRVLFRFELCRYVHHNLEGRRLWGTQYSRTNKVSHHNGRFMWLGESSSPHHHFSVSTGTLLIYLLFVYLFKYLFIIYSFIWDIYHPKDSRKSECSAGQRLLQYWTEATEATNLLVSQLHAYIVNPIVLIVIWKWRHAKGVFLIVRGRLFQIIGPATEETRDPWRVRMRGTWNSPRAAGREWLRPGRSVIGVTLFRMYSGAVPWTIACIIVPSLKSMRCRIGSQFFAPSCQMLGISTHYWSQFMYLKVLKLDMHV